MVTEVYRQIKMMIFSRVYLFPYFLDIIGVCRGKRISISSTGYHESTMYLLNIG